MLKERVITGRSGPTPNQVAWGPLEGQLPMTHVVQGNRLGGFFALVVGLPWLLQATGFLHGEIRRTGVSLDQTFLVLLVLGGLFVTLFGLSQFIYREATAIDSKTVRWTRRGLSGAKAWQESLSQYRGVLKHSQYWSGQGSSGTSYMEYRLTLSHANPSKRVLLYEARNARAYPPADWERLWKRYASLFRLPVLEETADGVVSATLEDLTRSLKDKIAEGKVMVPVMDLQQPDLPAGLALSQQDDLWVIALQPAGNIPRIGLIVLMAMVVLGMAAVFYISAHSLPAFLILTVFGSLLIAAAVSSGVSTARKRKHPDQVAVDATTLWYRTWDQRQGWQTQNLPLSAIVSIALRQAQNHPGSGEQVVIQGQPKDLTFGKELTSAARQRLRDLLLFLVASA